MLFLILFFFFPQGPPRHDTYVGVCEISYNVHTEVVEVVQQVFTDDLEEALRLYTKNPSFDLDEGREAVLSAYYTRNISLSVEGGALSLRYLGDEQKEGSTWSYLEAPDVGSFREVSVINTLLMDAFPSQTHLVHVRKDRDTISLQLDREQPSGTVRFEE